MASFFFATLLQQHKKKDSKNVEKYFNAKTMKNVKNKIVKNTDQLQPLNKYRQIHTFDD